MSDLQEKLKEVGIALDQNKKDLAAVTANREALKLEVAEIEKKLEALNVTYSIGDRFVNEGKWFLVEVGPTVSMVALASGESYADSTGFRPIDVTAITEYELGCILDKNNGHEYTGFFTRYYDHKNDKLIEGVKK